MSAAQHPDLKDMGIKSTILTDFMSDDDLTERASLEMEYALAALARSAQSVLVNDFYNFHTGITEAQAAYRRGNLYLRELNNRKEGE